MPEIFHHGTSTEETPSGYPQMPTAASNVIAFPFTADDADAATFPLNKVVFTTDGASLLGKIGTKGTGYRVLNIISQIVRAPMMMVRVASSTTAATQDSNVIGTVLADGTKTGIQALLNAKTEFDLKPRILGAPGLDSLTVTSALIALAQKPVINGFVYGAVNATTKEAAVAYRQNFGAREFMPLFGDFKVGDTAIEAAAVALAMRALIDQTQGFSRSLSNVPIPVVTGLTNPVSWDLQDTSTDANYLNSKEITVGLRFKGYRFWGNRTTSADSRFCFEVYTRTAQILKDTIAESMFEHVDSAMSVGEAKSIIHKIDAKLKDMSRNGGDLLGGEATFSDRNTVENLMAGQIYFKYKYTPRPPMEHIGLTQIQTGEYLLDLINQLLTEV